jgi:hypothetical protein
VVSCWAIIELIVLVAMCGHQPSLQRAGEMSTALELCAVSALEKWAGAGSLGR